LTSIVALPMPRFPSQAGHNALAASITLGATSWSWVAVVFHHEVVVARRRWAQTTAPP